ncbi:hypothetical protein J1614_005586 [Plenodomus biglobosus]|nr:hypothetical protein J1614_005586 [Plenodomus biglobosus]
MQPAKARCCGYNAGGTCILHTSLFVTHPLTNPTLSERFPFLPAPPPVGWPLRVPSIPRRPFIGKSSTWMITPTYSKAHIFYKSAMCCQRACPGSRIT